MAREGSNCSPHTPYFDLCRMKAGTPVALCGLKRFTDPDFACQIVQYAHPLPSRSTRAAGNHDLPAIDLDLLRGDAETGEFRLHLGLRRLRLPCLCVCHA